MDLDEDTIDLARMLLHNASTMDPDVPQEGIEYLRQIRRAHSDAALALHRILTDLETRQ